MYNKQENICQFRLSFFWVAKKAMRPIALFAFVRLVFQHCRILYLPPIKNTRIENPPFH